jgi:hypothetical protein
MDTCTGGVMTAPTAADEGCTVKATCDDAVPAGVNPVSPDPPYPSHAAAPIASARSVGQNLRAVLITSNLRRDLSIHKSVARLKE